MKKISIIVPIYNAQNYIERCVQSLMEQTLREGIEYIFIDDCSSDCSLHVLKGVLSKYPERSPYIRIIENKVNNGIYKTRCLGAMMATGDYIGWVDSDDWVDLRMFEMLLDATKNGLIDVVVCDYVEYRQNRTTQVHFKSSKTPIECIEGYRSGQTFSGTLWNQIFRRELFVEHMCDIIPTNYSEDTYIIWHIYAHASSISFVNKLLYHYDKRNQQSLMHTRLVTKEAWLEQERNLIRIERNAYSNSNEYKISLCYFMFWRKYEYIKAFDSPRKFYLTFRKASRYILFFPGMNLLNKVKTYAVNNFYCIFVAYNKRFCS